ncbi:hypothetical protein EC988_002508, partial [Linderina pennispora]
MTTTAVDIDDIDDTQNSILTFIHDSKKQRDIPRELPSKVSSPSATDTEPEYIEILLSVYEHLISAAHHSRRESGTGEWSADSSDVVVTRPVNVITKTFGLSVGGKMRLNGEEFVHLHERGVLTVRDSGQVLDTGAVWRLAVGSAHLLVGVYTAYAYLRRLGFTVIHHVQISRNRQLVRDTPQQSGSASKKEFG